MPARTRRPPGAPTLADIAKETGVTVPTVSKVLNGRSDVSQATRERVQERLQEAGYPLSTFPRVALSAPTRTKAGAGSDAVGTGLIDLVVPGIRGSWVASMLAGVEDTVSQMGKDVVVTVAQHRVGVDSWVERLIARGSRGAVVALLTPTAEEHRRLRRAGVEVVLLDPGADPTPGVPTVGATNWSGGYTATKHLLEQGHRRIGLVAGSDRHQYSQARIDGYRSALAAGEIDFDPTLIEHGDWSRSGAQQATATLLTLAAPPTAIFACSDRMALGVYEQAALSGLTIPDDLSVVGFDDLPEARWLTPALTTVSQPITEMGATAGRILLRLMEGFTDGIDRFELSTRLVERESTAPAS